MSVAKGFRLSDDSTAKLDWNYVTNPDGSKSIIEEVEMAFAEFKYDGGGVTDEARLALLQFLSKVVLTDTHGQEYYDELFNALFPVATLTSITCVYTQSGTVYTHDSLDGLKADLVVTAHYDDASEQIVNVYRLSGELTAGTSNITVSYGSKTTTFNVNVTAGVPSTYTMYDYIYIPTTKTNQASDKWISLKTYANLNEVGVEFKYQALSPYNGGVAIWGVRTQSGNTHSFAWYSGTTGGSGTNDIRYHLHGVDSNPSIPYTFGDIVVVKYTNTAQSPSYLALNNSTPIEVVWVNNNTINAAPVLFTNAISGQAMTLQKNNALGYMKFFDLSGNLINHYIPVVRKEDNRIGMFDIVEQTFYTTTTAAYATRGNSNCYYAVENWS